MNKNPSLGRTADVLAGRVRQSPWLSSRPALLGMAPLLHRLLEVGMWAVAILCSVQAMGYSRFDERMKCSAS